MKEKNWKLTLFTWLYRVFCYLVPGGYALYAFLINTLISNQTSVWEDKAYETLRSAYAGDEDLTQACKNTAEMMNEALAAEGK